MRLDTLDLTKCLTSGLDSLLDDWACPHCGKKSSVQERQTLSPSTGYDSPELALGISRSHEEGDKNTSKMPFKECAAHLENFRRALIIVLFS